MGAIVQLHDPPVLLALGQDAGGVVAGDVGGCGSDASIPGANGYVGVPWRRVGVDVFVSTADSPVFAPVVRRGLARHRLILGDSCEEEVGQGGGHRVASPRAAVTARTVGQGYSAGATDGEPSMRLVTSIAPHEQLVHNTMSHADAGALGVCRSSTARSAAVRVRTHGPSVGAANCPTISSNRSVMVVMSLLLGRSVTGYILLAEALGCYLGLLPSVQVRSGKCP